MAGAQIAKWGNSLAVRLPRGIVREARLSEGDRVVLDLTDGGILLRSGKPRYTLQDLVSRITSRNRHAETDWGRPVGKERL